jgi:curved DNA-binding protein CbpA
MTLEEAREILGLGHRATRREIKAAYRRAARRWHPDLAPGGAEQEFRLRMQQVNAAYQRVLQFLESYHYRLEETPEAEADYQQWWQSRFGTGVWGPPAKGPGEREGK